MYCRFSIDTYLRKKKWAYICKIANSVCVYTIDDLLYDIYSVSVWHLTMNLALNFKLIVPADAVWIVNYTGRHNLKTIENLGLGYMLSIVRVTQNPYMIPEFNHRIKFSRYIRLKFEEAPLFAIFETLVRHEQTFVNKVCYIV